MSKMGLGCGTWNAEYIIIMMKAEERRYKISVGSWGAVLIWLVNGS